MVVFLEIISSLDSFVYEFLELFFVCLFGEGFLGMFIYGDSFCFNWEITLGLEFWCFVRER